MHRWIYHWHRGDSLFIGWVAATLLLVVLYLGSLPGLEGGGGSSGRRIDIEAFKTRLDAGELSGHEALWYHPKEEP
jgi:hypothetical protein